MGFQEAVRSCFRKYAVFVGRSPRSEYWWFALFTLLTNGVAYVLDGMLFGHEGGGSLIESIWSLVLILPSLAVTVRRLHDGDRAGWWILIALVPVVGVFILLYWMLRRGDAGPNRFGADPLAGSAAAPFVAG